MKARRQEGDCVAVFCPACKCAHSVPLSGPVKWEWNGSVDAPTIRPSLLIRNPIPFGPDPDRICHVVITDGKILFCADCTHELAGQTLELEDF